MKKSILLLTICLLSGLMAAHKPEGICADPDIARAIKKYKESEEYIAAKSKAKSIVLSLHERVNLLHTQKQSELETLEKQRDEVQAKFAGEIGTITSQQRILELQIQAIEDAKPVIMRALLQGLNVTGIVRRIEAEIEKAFAQSSVLKK